MEYFVCMDILEGFDDAGNDELDFIFFEDIGFSQVVPEISSFQVVHDKI